MISREEVLKLAELARLKLTEAELESFGKDISGILEYVGAVSAAKNPQHLEAGDASASVHTVLRADEPYPEGSPVQGKREAIVAQFPEREGDYNVVRKIIQKDE